MSQENVNLIRRGFEHVARTGELSREHFHPDLIWDTTTFGIGFNLKKCVGIDEANIWLAEWTEGFESWSLDIEEVFDAGDQVVTFVRQHAKARQGGPEVEMRLAQVWTLRDGLVARMEMYFDRAEALEAAGATGVGDLLACTASLALGLLQDISDCHLELVAAEVGALGRVMMAPVPRTLPDRYAPRFGLGLESCMSSFGRLVQVPPSSPDDRCPTRNTGRAMSEESVRHTFLFADLAGFSALTEAHGDEQAVELALGFFALARSFLADYDAEEVKTIGDAMMVRAHDAGKAVGLGLRIVDELGSRPGFPIVRVGMHTGTAIERDGDWFGATVNVAARISAAAGGNQVLLSGATLEAAGSLGGVELSRHGDASFKNITEPVALYRAVREGRQDNTLPIDPVCRMAVDSDHAVGQLRYEGELFFFCSLDCARHFAADPDHHIRGLKAAGLRE